MARNEDRQFSAVRFALQELGRTQFVSPRCREEQV